MRKLLREYTNNRKLTQAQVIGELVSKDFDMIGEHISERHIQGMAPTD